MIVFDLKCNNGHIFEGWFKDSQNFETQRDNGHIECPVCNDVNICVVPSAFAIKHSPSPSQEGKAMADIEKLGRKVAEFVDKNFDNVGSDFAKEALKIHYGVSEPRNIRGVSTESEEKMLVDEGVKFFKFPMPPSSDTEN